MEVAEAPGRSERNRAPAARKAGILALQDKILAAEVEEAAA